MLSMLAPKVFNKKILSFCTDFKIKDKNSTKEACRFEFEAILVYKSSYGTARAARENPVFWGWEEEKKSLYCLKSI